MAGLCAGDNEPPGSLKAIYQCQYSYGRSYLGMAGMGRLQPSHATPDMSSLKCPSTGSPPVRRKRTRDDSTVTNAIQMGVMM
ncbi:hypothetical protein ANN_08195 [Periplaneta americana]|uniref:Uncharacterized protein n=1 Tax=Periplaneta americana TaxID=6978 RepID=A0ABQ8T0Q8_PERAM|nr:hypothetical protein ANN_08195 [Periplaneta americana]